MKGAPKRIPCPWEEDTTAHLRQRREFLKLIPCPWEEDNAALLHQRREQKDFTHGMPMRPFSPLLSSTDEIGVHFLEARKQTLFPGSRSRIYLRGHPQTKWTVF